MSIIKPTHLPTGIAKQNAIDILTLSSQRYKTITAAQILRDQFENDAINFGNVLSALPVPYQKMGEGALKEFYNHLKWGRLSENGAVEP